MKFELDSTTGDLPLVVLSSGFKITTIDGDCFIEIDTLEELMRLSKLSPFDLIITSKDKFDDNFDKIELYDTYRE